MSQFTFSVPVSYSFENLYAASRNPSQVHSKNTALFMHYGEYLFKKCLSVIEFTNLPSWWEENYFRYTLFGLGFLAVFKDPSYGPIPQNCSLSDTRTIFYQPKRVLIANPALPSPLELTVGEDCEILKLQPDYQSIIPLVDLYADSLAIAQETLSVNMLNSKVSMVFFAENKPMAESYKKMYDQITSGVPMTVVDKSMLDEDGKKGWDFFVNSIGQNYIVDRVLNDMKTIEDQFNTRIGIPNANTQKKERMISSEVESNDVDTMSLVDVWLTTLKADLKKINRRFGLNIGVRYRYADFYRQNEEKEAQSWQEDQE